MRYLTLYGIVLGSICGIFLTQVYPARQFIEAATLPERFVQRIQQVYPTPSLSFEEVNRVTRAATVNILCTSSVPQLGSISGSGVIIDARGIILTNAHIAQYMLLDDRSPTSTTHCSIRTGSPARETYTAELIYLPSRWLEKHAPDIQKSRPSGTGESDWALLRIVTRTDQGALPTIYPFILPEMRELATFTDDSVLLASYPAGFLGSSAIVWNLYTVSTIVPVGQLYTFGSGRVDALSLGGNILAQAGSSGGAVANKWGRLVGIITTSSEATTTAARELRAITLFHVDQTMREELGIGLYSFLSHSPQELGTQFKTTYQPHLLNVLSHYIR